MADWAQRLSTIRLGVAMGSRVIPVVLDVLEEHAEKSDKEKAEIATAQIETSESASGSRVSRQTISLFVAAVMSLAGDLAAGEAA